MFLKVLLLRDTSVEGRVGTCQCSVRCRYYLLLSAVLLLSNTQTLSSLDLIMLEPAAAAVDLFDAAAGCMLE